jgi:hypothetical protein
LVPPEFFQTKDDVEIVMTEQKETLLQNQETNTNTNINEEQNHSVIPLEETPMSTDHQNNEINNTQVLSFCFCVFDFIDKK